MLKQFKLVGLTENEDCYAAQLCVLIGLQPEVCLETMQKESTHQRPPHPKLSDFSAEFQSWWKQKFPDEFAIYDIAKEFSRAMNEACADQIELVMSAMENRNGRNAARAAQRRASAAWC